MIDPRRRSAFEGSRWVSGRGRALAIAGGVLAIVLMATGLAFVLGGGLRGTALPAPSVPVGGVATLAATTEPTPGFTGSPSPTATPSAGASFTPDAGQKVGIRAQQIRIERLGIDLPIIEGDGIDAPIGKAAHFPSSGWPDGGTNIYIYGHAREGMFIALWDARKGDTVVLDLVDGTSRTYVVTQILPKVPWDAIEYLDPTAPEQLTIQTSTSYYPTAPRFIVIAVPRS